MKATLLTVLGLIIAGAAWGSSEVAWEEFRAKVKESCAALTDAVDATIEVNDFGSESYGAALVTVRRDEQRSERMICIYDKRSETAEMTAPFTE